MKLKWSEWLVAAENGKKNFYELLKKLHFYYSSYLFNVIIEFPQNTLELLIYYINSKYW